MKGPGNLSYDDFVKAGVITDELQLEGLNFQDVVNKVLSKAEHSRFFE